MPTSLNPDRRLRLALRLLLEGRHQGRENAATWREVQDELEAQGLHVANVRRLQEAAAYLRRVDKVVIGGTSKAGVFVIADDVDRRFALGERVKRLHSEAEEIRYLDRALYEQLIDVLPGTTEAAP